MASVLVADQRYGGFTSISILRTKLIPLKPYDPQNTLANVNARPGLKIIRNRPTLYLEISKHEIYNRKHCKNIIPFFKIFVNSLIKLQ